MGGIDSSAMIGMILMIAGFILVGVEMVLPGFSFPGIGGIACLTISIFLISKTIEQGIVITMVIITVLAVMLGVILWLLSKGRISRSIVLTEELNKDKGYTSSEDLSYLLGREGTAYTDLRPSGIGSFGEDTFDVISEGEYIRKGTAIYVKEVQGSKLIVKENKNKMEVVN